jgi:dCTP deaminase
VFWDKQHFDSALENLFKQGTYDPKAVDRAAYNLRLGEEAFVSSDEAPITLTNIKPYLPIHPGDYVLLTTYEYLTMPPNVLGFITLRYRYKKLGLMNVSGFHVDPNFKGRLVFSVFNVGTNDVLLKFKDRMFMLFITAVEEGTQAEGQTDQLDTEPHKHDNQNSFSLEDVIAIRGRSASLVQMESRIHSIESTVRTYGAIVMGALVVLFALVVGLVVK